MKIFATIFFLLYFSIQGYSQVPFVIWQKTFGSNNGDYPRSIRVTTDGGYIIAGTTEGSNGDVKGYHGNIYMNDYWIVKLNSAGLMEWQKCLGGDYSELGADIRQTPDGGYIVAGSSASRNGDVTGNHGGLDFWIVKLTPGGDITWQKSFGGSKNEYAYSIDLTNDGGYIIAGHTESSDGDITVNHGYVDYWIIKIDGNGNLKWQKSLGGRGYDAARSVRATNDGGCIVAGHTESTDGDITGNHGKTDYWVVKLDNTGNIQWQKALGGSESDEAWSVQLTNDGGYIVAGYTSSNDGNVSGNHNSLGSFSDFWVVKLNGSGNIQWQKCYGGRFNEIAYHIQQTPDGGYVVAGSAESADGDATCNAGITDIWVIKINSTGKIEWQKSMGGNSFDEAFCIQPLSDGNYIIAGNTCSKNIPGYHPHDTYEGTCGDYWIIKLSPPVPKPPDPVVTISPASGIICGGSTATFTASAMYAGISPVYQWVRNGIVVGSNNPVYTASDFADNDQLICNVSGDEACDLISFYVSDTVIIHTNNNYVQPEISITTSNTFICNGTPVIFKASVLNGVASPVYQWKVNGITTYMGGNEFITNSIKAGDIISCVYLDDSGCTPDGAVVSNTIQIRKDLENIAVSISGSAIICEGSASTYIATPVNAGANPFYQWQINGMNAGTNSSNFTSASLKNGDILSCTITPDPLFTCVDAGIALSNNIIITVIDKVTPSINITSSKDTICAGTEVLFLASPVNAGTNPFYQWKINNINAGTNSKTFTTSNLVNNDVITCTITTDPVFTCANTTTAISGNITMTVISQASPSVNITASSNDVCAGSTLFFNAAAHDAGTSPSYQWMLNNSPTGNNSSIL